MRKCLIKNMQLRLTRHLMSIFGNIQLSMSQLHTIKQESVELRQAALPESRENSEEAKTSESHFPLSNNRGRAGSALYSVLLHPLQQHVLPAHRAASSCSSLSFSCCSSTTLCLFCSSRSSSHCSSGPLTADIWLHRFLVNTEPLWILVTGSRCARLWILR